MNRTTLFTFISVMPFIASGRRLLISSNVRRQRAAFGSHHSSYAYALGSRQRGALIKRLPGILSFSSKATSGNSSASDAESNWDIILPFEKNHHNSVKITVPNKEGNENDPYSLTTFQSKLQATIATAKELHKTAVWVTIPISRSRLMEEAHKSGFEFHHAEGSVATLKKWLLEDEDSRIPTYATHQVGVGAVVINSSSDEILCVREKRNNYRPWKIPGGLAELGEDLDEAVIREVYEETGIQCAFSSVLGVRHTHRAQFGRSDLFFVCRLEPIPNEDGKINEPIPQEGEIEAVSWLPLNEYRNMVNSDDSKIGHPMMSQVMKVVDQGDGKETDIQRMIIPSVVPGRKQSPLYHAPVR